MRNTSIRVNIQCEVEQPEIYLLVLGSSSVEDQAAVIPDRAECLSNESNASPIRLCRQMVKLHAHVHAHVFYSSYTCM